MNKHRSDNDLPKTSINDKESIRTSFIDHLNQDLLDYGCDDNYRVKISKIYLCSLVLSIIFHIMDVGTDAYLAYQYFHFNEKHYFFLTVSFIIFPAFINTMLSIRMYAGDKESVSFRKWILRGCGLVLQVSPLARYFDALQYALKLRNEEEISSREYDKYSKLLLKEDSNLALLRIIEGFLEAAPQQVLQVAILLRRENNEISSFLQIYQYMTISTSLVSVAWSFAVYNRSVRFAREDKRKLSWTGSIAQVSWFFLVTSSRILAISEAASVFPLVTFSACTAHWLLMTAWILFFYRPWFCRKSEEDSRSELKNLMECSFCAVLGLVYIFAFLPTKDGDTRYKYVFYYSIYFFENTAAIFLWSVCSDEKIRSFWWFVPLLTTTFCMFLFGVVLMFVYYWYFHPERGLCPNKQQTAELSLETCELNDNRHASKMVQTDI